MDSTTPGFIEVGDGEWVGSTPSRRFPVWTRGNAGEVYPNVVLPLTYTSGFEAGERAMRAAVEHGGLMSDADFAEDGAAVATGVFGGYAYLNLSFNRVAALRMPGGDVEDVDRAFMGDADPPPHVPSKADKSFLAGLRGLRYLFRTLRTTSLPQLEADKEKVAALQARFGDVTAASDADLRALMDELEPFFEDLFETHLIVSGQAGLSVAVLTKICEDRLDDASLALRLLGGIGDVESAAPAAALFRLGRLVADDQGLTATFESGVSGVEERLRSLDTDAGRRFVDHFDRFLTEFGSRGPNEWDIAAHTWGTDHELALTLVDRMRGAATDHDPAQQHLRLSAGREQLHAETRARLRGLNRWFFDRTLRAATLFSQGRERSKTTIVAGIHEMRLASHELARRSVERGASSPEDMWLMTMSEIDDYLADLPLFAGLVAERRRMYERLKSLEPPFFFDGDPPPVDTWLPRARPGTPVDAGSTLTGLGGCPGVARGRARVVLDPSDPGALGPGDVLIAPITDPAWTPLFVPAEAVVVDVGAVMSHAVIVSRELGIPCVVSVTDATRSIPDGALVEVDGDAGTVRILDVDRPD